MSKHDMPSLDAWVTLTRPFQEDTRSLKHLVCRRGSNMKPIDAALKVYWEMYANYGAASPHASPAAQGPRSFRILGALRAIVASCDKWLAAKAGKGDAGLTGKRRVAVTDLRRKAEAQWRILHRKNQGAGAAASIPLVGGYTKEAISAQPVVTERGFKTAKSASSVVAVRGDVALGALQPEQEAALGDVLGILQAHDLDAMSQAQFEAVAVRLGQIEGTEGFQEPAEVVYLKRAGKTDMLAIPHNGSLLDASGALFDTGLAPTGILKKVMYALDAYGNLLIRRTSGRVDGRNFNHSSLTGGKNVICAGEIAVRQGELRYINNNSGHYQPNAMALQGALQFLAGEGLTINNTKVQNTAPGAAAAGPWRGTTFVGNPVAGPDWNAALDQQYQFV